MVYWLDKPGSDWLYFPGYGGRLLPGPNITEREGVCRMIEKRMDGILSHVLFPISNGPLEGTNNMIKSLRRQAFGYRDTRYFFLKIWDASRLHPKSRSYSRFQPNCA